MTAAAHFPPADTTCRRQKLRWDPRLSKPRPGKTSGGSGTAPALLACVPESPKLLDRVRQEARLRHYSHRTEQAYVSWVRRFILFHRKRHPRDLGGPDVAEFLSSLATGGLSASTQNQALSAVLFLYDAVLGQRLAWMTGIVRAQRPARLPVVLSRDEVASLLSRLHGPVRLMASLMYGSGLRLLECAELRVKDINFDRGELIIRDGKGGKDRVTMLPTALKTPLLDHLARVRAQHEKDLAAGRGSVALPGALRAKYPNAAREWAWQWVFPATRFYLDPTTCERRRHHLHESVLQRAVKDAARAAGIPRPATCHSLRHHADSRIMPSALGHESDAGGDRAIPSSAVGIIRGVRETRGVDRAADSGRASRRWASCAPAPAL